MYDKNLIIQNFMGSSPLVGLRQNDNPTFQQLPPSLLYNNSNTLIQHPLINIENLDMCARNYSKFEYAAWDNATAYTAGQRVKYSNVVYEAVNDNIGEQPDNFPADWAIVDLLGLYLTDVFSNGIEEAVSAVFRKKKLADQTKTLLSSLRPYDQPGSYQDLIINEGDLVGVAIQLRHTNNIVAIIEKIGFQVSEANPTLKFFLYHSSQVEGPIATITVNHTKLYSFQWHTSSSLKMHYITDDYDAGGIFILMYDQNLLVGQAVKKVYNFNLAPCSYCDQSLVTRFNMSSKYMGIRSVRVRAVNRVPSLTPGNPDQLWDLTKMENVPDNNFGLNFEFTVRCDITRFIIQQRDVWAYAVRDTIIMKMLEGFTYSTRQNVAQEKLNQLARMELQGTIAGGFNFPKRVEKMIDEVDFEFANLDSTCMPCNQKNGLRSQTFGLSR